MFTIIQLLGGLSLFLFGTRVCSEGLKHSHSRRFTGMLRSMTKTKLRGTALGVFFTLFTQSSSATSVILVSMVQASLLTVAASLPILLGAGIGTTLTVQLIAFRIFRFALLFVSAGVFLQFTFRKKSWQTAGEILLGLGLIFYGMQVMSLALAPLKDSALLTEALAYFHTNPWAALGASTIVTALVQSSGAVIAILISFAVQGTFSLSGAEFLVSLFPMILGANLGTCITAFLGSIGNSREAKQVALAQFLQKLTGILAIMPFVSWLGPLVHALSPEDRARSIANAHTLFNLLLVLFLLPASGLISKITGWLLPGQRSLQKAASRYLDRRLLDSPDLALQSVGREIIRLGRMVEEQLFHVARLFQSREAQSPGGPETDIQSICSKDQKIDDLQKEISAYLNRLLSGRLHESASRTAEKLFYVASDLESIGDVVVKNIIPLAEKLQRKDHPLSAEGSRELLSLQHSIIQQLPRLLDNFPDLAPKSADNIIRNSKRLHSKMEALRHNHLSRLIAGKPETLATSTIHLDLLASWRNISERIAAMAAYFQPEEQR